MCIHENEEDMIAMERETTIAKNARSTHNVVPETKDKFYYDYDTNNKLNSENIR
jgi:hypothetical protein